MKVNTIRGASRPMRRGILATAPAAAALLAAIAIPAFLLVSCAPGQDGPRGGFALEEAYGRGSAVQFTVRVSRTSITTAESLRLVLEVRAAEDWNVEFPDIPDSLGEFQVVEREGEERRLDRNRNLISTRRYTLEPFLPARYTIPPLEVRFGSGGGYPFSLLSEEITVEVTSVLPPQLGEPDIEEIAGPLELRSRRLLWIALGGGAAAAAGAALAAVLLLRRRRRTSGAAAAEASPWQAASRELDELVALGLIEEGRFREFYEGVSALTRRYIERRFEVRAPELTTEEFLERARRSEALAGHRQALGEFLAHCDLVKFARYEPSAEEARLAEASCREFLSVTAPGTRGA